MTEGQASFGETAIDQQRTTRTEGEYRLPGLCMVNSSAVEAATDVIFGASLETNALHDPFWSEGQNIQIIATDRTSIDPIATQLGMVLACQDLPEFDNIIFLKPATSKPTEAVPEAIVQNWQFLANADLSEKGYLFLLRLAKKEPGWRGQSSRPLDYRSLANFLRFWRSVREHAVEPEFVLVPSGNLQAEWYKDDDQFVELEFQQDNRCLFGLFDGESVLEGAADVQELLAFLSVLNFEPLKWSYGE